MFLNRTSFQTISESFVVLVFSKFSNFFLRVTVFLFIFCLLACNAICVCGFASGAKLSFASVSNINTKSLLKLNENHCDIVFSTKFIRFCFSDLKQTVFVFCVQLPFSNCLLGVPFISFLSAIL